VRDDVDQLAAPDGIVHDMAMWPHPHRAFRDVDVLRHRVSCGHAAPADAAGETRRISAEQILAHDGMNAVRPDDHIGFDLAPVGKACDRAARALFNADAAGSEVQLSRFQRAMQHVEQVSAMDGQVRRAELLAKRAAPHA
jgi:hypothetical protein